MWSKSAKNMKLENIKNINKLQERYDTFEVIIHGISWEAKAMKKITKIEDSFNWKN